MKNFRAFIPLAILSVGGCGGGGAGTVTTPVITTHPASLSVTVGSSATFSVVATGTNLSYQWTKGGTAIAGATLSTFTIPSVALTDAGTFAVIVTNTVHSTQYSTTSNNATLTVNNSGDVDVTVK